MNSKLTFTESEQMLCATANLIEENKTYWVAIGGPPLIAILLARSVQAPDVFYVVEDGTVSPQPPSYVPFLSGASGAAGYRALAWKDMNTMGFHCALGYYDYGVLDCLQVDMYGNINSSFIGEDYEHPKRRFGGPGGANEIASMCWRTIIMSEHEKRKFPKRVDFISSPGYLDGSPQAREKAGLPRGTGPYRVVSDKAIFGFDEKTRQMKLLAITPWTTKEEVMEEMDFEPLVAESLDTVSPPTEQQLTLLRSHIDPEGRIIGQGKWIEWDPSNGK